MPGALERDLSAGARGVLITGGSGFVGRAVVEALCARGNKVVATTTGSQPDDLPRGVTWVQWDATQTSVPDVDWDRIGAVIHLAAPRGVAAFPQNACGLYQTAVASTFQLLERAREQGNIRFLIGSTGDVLGDAPGLASEADTSYGPSSFYGATKACGELMVAAYSQQISTAILRFYHPYGTRGGRFLINRLFQAVREGKETRVEGEKGIVLNPVWIDDLVEVITLALSSSATGIFHFAGPEQVTLLELIHRMGEALGITPLIRHVSGGPSNRHAGSYSRSREVLGYMPRIDLTEGIRRLKASPDLL